MLPGDPPLLGPGPRATMAKQVTETPRPLRMPRPEVPPHVEGALGRALAKNPADRFASAGAFVAALQGQGPASGGPLSWTAARCIAVLPFVNASPDPDNEYLSDGITDELIAALAGVEGLREIGRASCRERV